MDNQNISNNPFTEVPFEVYETIGVRPYDLSIQERDAIKSISDWSMSNGDVEAGLVAIKTKLNELGAPRIGEKGFEKLARWVSLQKQIEALQKRQEAV